MVETTPSKDALTLLSSVPSELIGDWDAASVASGDTEKIEVGVSTKKRYNILVAGHNGSGKTTFCVSALNRYFPEIKLNPVNGPTLAIEERGRCEKTQGSTQIIVTITDTQGWGETANNNDRIAPIIEHIQKQNREYEVNEGYRTPNHQEKDTRIHCCFYFIMPHRVTEFDIEVMLQLQDKVPLVPIVAKTDTMTIGELKQQLFNVHKALEENEIKIFDFKETGIDDSWLENFMINEEKSVVAAQEGEDLAAPAPLAAVRSQIPNVFAVITGQRGYSWGIADEANPDHSDTPRLHRVLFTSRSLQSLGRLQDMTNEIHEKWRNAEKQRTKQAEEEEELARAALEIARLQEEKERNRLKAEERKVLLV